MPVGVEVEVDGDGFATIGFVDTALRGPGLGRLLAIGGPDTIETLTCEGSRFRYRVPEGNAREAGLIDVPKPAGVADAVSAESAAPAVVGSPQTGQPNRSNRRQRRRN